jgi:Membrane domain of glycerophosphoryl diester phosphodiesterase
MVREVVREVWRLFLARFWRTIVTVALLLAPLELAIALLDPDFSSIPHGWWVWVAATTAASLTAYPWAIAAVVHDVGEGDDTPVGAYRNTAGRLPDLLISAAVTTVAIALGTFALVVPGAVLMARWALVVPLIVLAGTPWRVALSRSNELVRGQTWTVIGIFLALFGIGFLVALVPAMAGYAIGGVVGAWISALALATVFVAFFAYAPFVLYRRLSD